MRIGADERIGKNVAVARENALREVFEIDLMNDARRGRHDAQIFKRLRTPFQKFITFAVALKFQFRVANERGFRSEKIHLDGMVNDQIYRHKRIDFFGVAAELLHRIAHRGEVNHARHAGEILHHHARGHEWQFHLRGIQRVPRREIFYILLRDNVIVHVAENGFEENFDGKGETFEVRRETERGEFVEAIHCVFAKRRACAKSINAACHIRLSFRDSQGPTEILTTQGSVLTKLLSRKIIAQIKMRAAKIFSRRAAGLLVIVCKSRRWDGVRLWIVKHNGMKWQ